MKAHKQMLEEWKRDPNFRAEYAALGDEFAIFDELLRARTSAGLTQDEVAKRMGTKPPAVARLEALSHRRGSSPSLATLRKYAAAVGCKLNIRLVPR